MEMSLVPDFEERKQSIPGNARPSWCEIDLNAISENFQTLKSLIGDSVKVIVSLKNNANGAGVVEISKWLEKLGVDGLAFGNTNDAVSARDAGVRIPILLYPNCLPEASCLIETHDFTITISTKEEADAWAATASRPIKTFIKVDGGGLRVGALPGQAVGLAKHVEANPKLDLLGAYAHPMTAYNDVDVEYERVQLEQAVQTMDAIVASGVALPIRMVSSSALVLKHLDMDLEAVDPGRLLFGARFDAVPERKRNWRPAVVGLKTRIALIKPIEMPDGMSFVPFFRIREGMRIGIVPFGWGDGYPTKIPDGACALVRGRRVPILPVQHSELLRIDLTDVPQARLGDVVVLMGRSGEEEITMDELSKSWGISETELTARMPRQLNRVYMQECHSECHSTSSL